MCGFRLLSGIETAENRAVCARHEEEFRQRVYSGREGTGDDVVDRLHSAPRIDAHQFEPAPLSLSNSVKD